MTMKKILLSFGFLICLFSYGFSSQEQPDLFIDGTKWKTMSMETKLGYMMGFQEGLKISRTAVLVEKSNGEPEEPIVESLKRVENWIQTYEAGNTRLGLIILTIDSVYSDEANSKLIAAALVPLVTKRIRGEISGEDFSQRLEKLKDVLR
jgi:hypothetical protein